MKQVVIPLSPRAGAVYLRANIQKRKKADRLVNRLIPEILNEKKKNIESLFKTMDEISEIAKANGLTPEILEEILREIKNENR